MTFDLKPYLARQKNLIDAALEKYIRHFCLSDRMYAPVWYAVEAGGKRIRPVLCLAACAAVGEEDRIALPAACALEMIHTYSLIHDDLPALDNDALRRGKPTCHVRFDEATAILSGDALLTMAFEVLAESGVGAKPADAYLWWKITQLISSASGCRGMIEGQIRDLACEGQKLNQPDLESLHRLKTGALIRAAVQSGGWIGGGDQEQIEQLTRYADHLGLAFQVVDDLLNVKGDPQLIGKAVGTDQNRGKNTYPALLGVERSEQYAQDLMDNALQSLSGFDNKADPLRAIARYVVERNR